ncbi:MAG: DUF1579 family protein [Emcibacteraceae bacterium]|nr:DUF1579 family protein [Emcibacteraceae bacterium]
MTSVYAQAPENIAKQKIALLDNIIGNWSKEEFSYSDDGTLKLVSSSKITFEKTLSNFQISGATFDITPTDAMNVDLAFTYDQYRKIYRMSVVDSIYGLMDIYEGVMNEDNNLMLDNMTSDTSFPSEGATMYFRFTLDIKDQNKISYLIESTSNKGQKWSPMLNYVMTRIK